MSMLTFGPGTTETSRAVAWPISVPLLNILIFTYGTVAEYSVGFVRLILASMRSVDLVVSRMRKDPTWGEKPSRSPPDIARIQTISIIRCNAMVHARKVRKLTLYKDLPFCWDLPHYKLPKRRLRFDIHIGLYTQYNWLATK